MFTYETAGIVRARKSDHVAIGGLSSYTLDLFLLQLFDNALIFFG